MRGKRPTSLENLQLGSRVARGQLPGHGRVADKIARFYPYPTHPARLAKTATRVGSLQALRGRDEPDVRMSASGVVCYGNPMGSRGGRCSLWERSRRSRRHREGCVRGGEKSEPGFPSHGLHSPGGAGAGVCCLSKGSPNV